MSCWQGKVTHSALLTRLHGRAPVAERLCERGWIFFLALGLWRHEGIAQETTGITLMKTYTTHAQNVPTYHFIAKTKQTRETLQNIYIYI